MELLTIITIAMIATILRYLLDIALLMHKKERHTTNQHITRRWAVGRGWLWLITIATFIASTAYVVVVVPSRQLGNTHAIVGFIVFLIAAAAVSALTVKDRG